MKNKDELLFLMADAALGEEPFPEQAPPGWRAQLEVAARLQWHVLRRHPWLGRLMSITRPQPLARSLVYADWVFRALAGQGLGASERMQLHIVLHGFVQGLAVNLETEAEAVSETGVDDQQWMATQLGEFEALAASGRYPAFAALLGELVCGFDLDMDVLFELGLRSLLDGFAERIARS